MCWAFGCPSIQWKQHFLPRQSPSRVKWEAGFVEVYHRHASPILRWWTEVGGQIGVRQQLAFRQQNAGYRKVRRIQVWWTWRSTRQQDSANNCWAVLVVWTSAKSCQKTYFPSGHIPLDPGGHMLSQKLLADISVNWANHWVCQRKPAFSDENTLNLLLIPLGSLFPPFCHSVRSTPLFNNFFALKNHVFAIAEVFGNLRCYIYIIPSTV